jgi:hypothetical protein
MDLGRSPMPMLQDLATGEVRKLGTKEEGGLPLVIDEDWEYELCSAEIPDNSRILLYTDGLDEALAEHGSEDEQFGEEGIINTLKETVICRWKRRWSGCSRIRWKRPAASAATMTRPSCCSNAAAALERVMPPPNSREFGYLAFPSFCPLGLSRHALQQRLY